MPFHYSRTKKIFPVCGHKGFGSYCHRCRQAEELAFYADIFQTIYDTEPEDPFQLPPQVKHYLSQFPSIGVKMGGKILTIRCEPSGRRAAFFLLILLMKKQAESLREK